jgi:SAM-dependent methyltransferase
MKCRLCGNSELKLFYTQGNINQFKYYKCPNCGLINLDLDNLSIENHQEKYVDSFPDPTIPELNKGAVQTYSFIKKYVPFKGDFLDIGCGNGALLYYARLDGWNVNGLELSEQLAKRVTEQLNIPVVSTNFPNYEELDNKYDLISLRHVLEHLPDPISALNKIGNLLKNNDYALLEFPNINGLSFRVKRTMGRIGLHKKKYSEDYIPGHCNEFNIHSFKYLLNETGFRLIKWETYSLRPLHNFIYNKIKIGAQMRVLIRKEK